MIPKIIHYCWFGHAPLPPLAERCIASWRRFLPGYEIREWTEENFDVGIIPFTAEAYAQKKYAFVSDYARFWILYKYGGLYFDTDVEVIRPLDDIVERGPFMGFETDAPAVRGGHEVAAANPGLGLGVAPGLGLVKKLMEEYHGQHFVFHDDIRSNITVVGVTTRLLLQEGLREVPGIQQVGGVWIYPSEYFCPISTVTGKLHVTPQTRTIHHYAASWAGDHFALGLRLKRYMPEWMILLVCRVKALMRHRG